MPEWTERAVANCGSMADVRKVDEDMRKLRKEAIERLADLDRHEYLGSVKVLVKRYFFGVNDSSNIVRNIMGMLGERENVWGDDGDDQAAISGMMETVDGIRCSRSVDLPKSVASAKREEASKWASRDFREEWDKSMRVPIERIGERFR